MMAAIQAGTSDHLHHRDQDTRDEDLVGGLVHEDPVRAHLSACAGDPSIEEVGDGRDDRTRRRR